MKKKQDRTADHVVRHVAGTTYTVTKEDVGKMLTIHFQSPYAELGDVSVSEALNQAADLIEDAQKSTAVVVAAMRNTSLA